jgi:predicted ribosomally synthesized peptide with SipW-like signal peptide
MATQNQRSRSQSTARALLASFLALLLCFATLLGTTYAWFTDSATTGTNTIKAGNLDVDLQYYTGSLTASIDVSDTDHWASFDEDTHVFSDVESDDTTTNYWEPGHAEVVYLKVSNNGSLALKYNLSVSVSGETEGKTADGKLFKLSDYIMLGSVY